ncbi:hypothetical protein P3L44_10210 [Providencia sp. PROV175]|uniref:hypothetical protein n=1 Tax=Providencia sp. PROV175 TaxID=2949878 RepID=UPI00234BD761|nr:hypothetical protein [Providencia sp. PROV175]WOB89088.1 hypothetical protein P3L44_10080 [Providencia sp. PROV175]WOB89099.1 hypothetical protein P3L44_10145 [Providencia sp. PROV175]WOB89111.1 hypothetical protein P3L44_10210 [Providencia sp. PROV175]
MKRKRIKHNKLFLSTLLVSAKLNDLPLSREAALANQKSELDMILRKKARRKPDDKPTRFHSVH